MLHFIQNVLKISYHKLNHFYIILGVHNENQLPSITFPPNLFEENDTTPQLAETPFRAEQLTEENDQSENRDIEISEHGTIFKKNYKSSKINNYISQYFLLFIDKGDYYVFFF